MASNPELLELHRMVDPATLLLLHSAPKFCAPLTRPQFMDAAQAGEIPRLPFVTLVHGLHGVVTRKLQIP